MRFSSLVTWADATRTDTNGFYDMGFEREEALSKVEQLKKDMDKLRARNLALNSGQRLTSDKGASKLVATVKLSSKAL